MMFFDYQCTKNSKGGFLISMLSNLSRRFGKYSFLVHKEENAQKIRENVGVDEKKCLHNI
jgi:hypothetical protein